MLVGGRGLGPILPGDRDLTGPSPQRRALRESGDRLLGDVRRAVEVTASALGLDEEEVEVLVRRDLRDGAGEELPGLDVLALVEHRPRRSRKGPPGRWGRARVPSSYTARASVGRSSAARISCPQEEQVHGGERTRRAAPLPVVQHLEREVGAPRGQTESGSTDRDLRLERGVDLRRAAVRFVGGLREPQTRGQVSLVRGGAWRPGFRVRGWRGARESAS